MNDTIQIFITGGTFDKSYNYRDGNLYFEKTHLPEMLKRSRCKLDIDIKTLMMIDSLEMNQTHIDSIIYNCKNCKSSKIIIIEYWGKSNASICSRTICFSRRKAANTHYSR